MTDQEATCAHCSVKSQHDAELKRCAVCHTTAYCSRECQLHDWQRHKIECREIAGTGPPRPPTGGRNGNFHRLQSGTWLYGRPELEVYELLIDSFRLRLDDEYKYDGAVFDGSIYAGEATNLPAFTRFLDQVTETPKLLPAWWSDEKKQACLDYARDATGWFSLSSTPEKNDLIDHYADSLAPMKMRMFCERVYGFAPGGASGEGMMERLMALELSSASTSFINQTQPRV